MGESSYNAADLNSVLQTLSSLAPQAQAPAHQSTYPTSLPTSQKRNFSSTETPTAKTQDPRTQDPRQLHTKPPSTRPPATSGPASSTITTWPTALRHVMRTVSSNEETQLRIRGMIRSQHHHEQSWFDARRALIKQQEGRPQKQRELDAVLRSIGAPVKEDDGSAEKEFAAEIAKYDLKVHAAAVKMAEALSAELRAMDIPFFTIRKDLVQDTPQKEDYEDVGLQRQNQTSTPAGSSPITKSELIALQNRMLGLLEDLCKE
ncbi:unnamed protein product [Penicillium salamii]|uniref:Uncharacterized protein n=1 Tax=Penicillium salamii TaxID=1612424 RepID=A0A9W4JCG4_9EURO|nr:unnamed protein product [Penicillium salamii]CAG8252695.1 unnamed protein product [Penicillium salamii]CAG8279024.1 unnamed protein product [Penicillium salamii]CAG8382427.1 unnamed protein product [Penicillium salamii]CAG8386800.1 unnamed protein product [Penicillium salamii]